MVLGELRVGAKPQRKNNTDSVHALLRGFDIFLHGESPDNLYKRQRKYKEKRGYHVMLQHMREIVVASKQKQNKNHTGGVDTS